MDYRWKYQEWYMINWHIIMKRYDDNHILVTCAKCKTLVIKTRKSIDNHHWCKHCRERYAYYWYVYWIKPWVISLQLSRWWTMNQILWLEPRKIKSEDFSVRDLIYLSKINEKLYKENKNLEKHTLLKYKIKKWMI